MNYTDAIKTITGLPDGQLIVCANGLISRETFSIDDREGNFYMIGSMGLASSIGLGVALSNPAKGVVILDGDGNLQMNLGTLPMIGALRPKNFLHIVLDNEVYASTGGQPTFSDVVRLEEIAISANYANARVVKDVEALKSVMVELLRSEGPSFLLVKITGGEGRKEPGRVTHTPEVIKERFMSAIGR